ncbi:MAG: VWA domain-containing protein [Phycisphaerales bacterium]
MWHVLIALGVLGVVSLGEWLHARRVARVARLAFGASARPALWVFAVPLARPIAAAIATWGLLFLATFDPVEIDKKPNPIASKHLLICLDASPSMQVKDAGPDREKVSRASWAGKIAQGILDRLDMESTRITIVAFYTEALPVVQETFDKEVVRNALDGLPMYVAFQPGATNIQEGVTKAMEYARRWPEQSATLLVISDGDAIKSAPPNYIPASIADTIVIGVGDPVKPSIVGGHSSRQDSMSLKQLAARLRGYYHEGNTKHLPSDVLDKLTMIKPRIGDRYGQRDLAILCTIIGCATLALVGPAMSILGRSWTFSRNRREAARRPSALPASPAPAVYNAPAVPTSTAG